MKTNGGDSKKRVGCLTVIGILFLCLLGITLVLAGWLFLGKDCPDPAVIRKDLKVGEPLANLSIPRDSGAHIAFKKGKDWRLLISFWSGREQGDMLIWGQKHEKISRSDLAKALQQNFHRIKDCEQMLLEIRTRRQGTCFRLTVSYSPDGKVISIKESGPDPFSDYFEIID
jgi:hypothetical protein